MNTATSKPLSFLIQNEKLQPWWKKNKKKREKVKATTCTDRGIILKCHIARSIQGKMWNKKLDAHTLCYYIILIWPEKIGLGNSRGYPTKKQKLGMDLRAWWKTKEQRWSLHQRICDKFNTNEWKKNVKSARRQGSAFYQEIKRP